MQSSITKQVTTQGGIINKILKKQKVAINTEMGKVREQLPYKH